MDKLKSMGEKMLNKEGQKQEGNAPNTGNEDYTDKGLDAAEKKFGVSQSRETNEMITDKGREMFEKDTGKKVPEKFSN